MKIKSNEALFNDIYHCAAKLTALAAIVQNDTEITQEQYKEWALAGAKNVNDIKDWMCRVYRYLQSIQND